ncbi:hypothetical protein BG653_04728 [Streptomyces platensis]|uniref:Uncharacterized protein n=1 Tax=Streptomyces platensis TaxID=58346 RepID=A0ABX3XSP3_STRPT|nr:hypothetical protein [Streptomyces platensis]OSY42568.1 hypothetical protein BG653_04728 [Streptomyces platensis]
MSHLPLPGAACVESGEPPLTTPEATIIVIVLVLATLLALAGLPSLSVFVLLAEAIDTGLRLARRLPATHRADAQRG